MNTILATQSEYAARIEKDVRAYRTAKAASKPAVKRTTTKRVTGVQALNEMGRRQSAALTKDMDNIKAKLAVTTDTTKRRVLKTKLYINYTMHAIMGLPALFLIGLVVKDLAF
jgi:hypothetical protein